MNFKSWKEKFKAAKITYKAKYSDENDIDEIVTDLSEGLTDNLVALRRAYGNTSDYSERIFKINGIEAAIISLENMVNKQELGIYVFNPLCSLNNDNMTLTQTYEYIRDDLFGSTTQGQLSKLDDVAFALASGFAIILMDGIPLAISVGVQGYNVRSISEPSGEAVLRGSREGFTESARNNVTMIRRRIHSPKLRFEQYDLGKLTKTTTYLCYIDGAVSREVLKRVRRDIGNIDVDSVLESGYIQPYFEQHPLSLFSTVGTTERPDTVCGKLLEGRIAVIVDGTPFALIIPHLFAENFQTMDDYTTRPYYAVLIRMLKYVSFFLSALLPGIYVAIGTFHQELLPDSLMYNIAKAQMNTPLSLIEEALLVHVIFEIVKEAGLRLPKPIGQAVSIVGGLVLGDAAVGAGFISAPIVIVVALAAVTGFVIPSLNEPIVIIRFITIFAGGWLGMFGVMLVLAMLLCNICSMDTYGIPYTSTISPFSKRFWQDVLLREGWRKMSKRNVLIQRFPGANVSDSDSDEQ